MTKSFTQGWGGYGKRMSIGRPSFRAMATWNSRGLKASLGSEPVETRGKAYAKELSWVLRKASPRWSSLVSVPVSFRSPSESRWRSTSFADLWCYLTPKPNPEVGAEITQSAAGAFPMRSRESVYLFFIRSVRVLKSWPKEHPDSKKKDHRLSFLSSSNEPAPRTSPSEFGWT